MQPTNNQNNYPENETSPLERGARGVSTSDTDAANPSQTIIILGHAGIGLTARLTAMRTEHPTAEILTEEEAIDKYPNLRQYINQSENRTPDYLSISETMYQKINIEAMELAMIMPDIDQPKAIKEHKQNFQAHQNRQYNNMFNNKQKYNSKMYKRPKV